MNIVEFYPPKPIYKKSDLRKDGTLKNKYKEFNRIPLNVKDLKETFHNEILNELMWQ